MGSKTFRSKKDISKHLSAQQKSNLSVVAYCQKHNIPLSTFFNWQKRYRVKSKAPKQQEPSFAQVTLPLQPTTYYEILKGDFTIRVPGTFDSSVLRRIIEVLA